MIHPKYPSNPLSHFLTGVTAPGTIPNSHHPPTQSFSDIENGSNTPLEVVNGNIGKSFTIAAILGLKKNAAAAAAAAAADNNNRTFEDVMNLSLNHNLTTDTTKGVNHFAESQRLLSLSGGNLTRLPGISALSPHYAHHQPSALQSLQQLHQQHSTTTTNHLNFQQRERNRNDHHGSKKSSMKSKRVRTIFTPEQLERLEAEFERQQYMVGPERLYLAHTLQLTEAQVKVWFQNRRIKWRKHHLEITQQRLAIFRQRQITATGAAAISNSIQPVETDMGACSDSMDATSGQEDN